MQFFFHPGRGLSAAHFPCSHASHHGALADFESTMSNHSTVSNPALPGRAEPRTPLLRLEADFLRPYRWAIVLGLLGLLAQSVLLLPVPLLPRVGGGQAGGAGGSGHRGDARSRDSAVLARQHGHRLGNRAGTRRHGGVCTWRVPSFPGGPPPRWDGSARKSSWPCGAHCTAS